MNSDIYLPIGTVLDSRYKVERHLASGGFGNTYLVTTRLGNHKMVVKEFFMPLLCGRDRTTNDVTISIESNRLQFDSQRRKFQKEAERIHSLNHPNVVKVTDLFEENGTVYYVMDFINGKSLSQLDKPMGEAVALGYVRQELSALEYVHSQGVLHLDIKPSNIMVDKAGNAILIDFGASKLFDVDSENQSLLSTTAGIAYTPGYAPFEQMSNHVKSLGTHSDIYALGATLYNLLTGSKPPLPVEIFETGLPLLATMSPHVKNALESAMKFSIKERVDSAAELCELLKIANVEEKTPHQQPPIDTTIPINEKTDMTATVAEQQNDPKQTVISEILSQMVKVEGGSFMREKEGFFRNEKYEVTLTTYYIGKFQVTQKQWVAIMGKNPAYFKGENLPVEGVSWNDCQEFCRRLSEMSGRDFRLPTEAEWEFAARGGNSSRNYNYSGSDNVDEVAWYCNNSQDETHPVGQKRPNELGLYDMSGNVWEWCYDYYGEYSSSAQTNPTGPASGSRRVLRGGSWRSYAQYCRVSDRYFIYPDYRYNDIGFRLALCP